MANDTGQPERLEPLRRIAAGGAVVLGFGALVVFARGIGTELLRTVGALSLVFVSMVAACIAATRTRLLRLIALAVAAGAFGAAVALVWRADDLVVRVGLGLVLVGAAAWLSRFALRQDAQALRQARTPGTPVGPARRGALIMNLRSGGGKAERFDLVGECRQRGIEPIVLREGDDLQELARDAIAKGADVLGMAGGDGSLALVASVAGEAGVPMVCVPAGTRNHFALDLGLDRADVVGALGAFDAAVERLVDLGSVSGRVFVNNVSLGVYAKVVQTPEYRDAKAQTTAQMLPELLGPDAEPFDLAFDVPDGRRVEGAQIVMISNNPYDLTSLDAFGSRPRLDTGELGMASVLVDRPAQVASLMAAQAAGRLDTATGVERWSSPRFVVESGAPVEAGVDGEALVLDPPLVFESLPGAVRVRLPLDAPGYSPAARKPPSIWWSLGALARALRGLASPIDAATR